MLMNCTAADCSALDCSALGTLGTLGTLALDTLDTLDMLGSLALEQLAITAPRGHSRCLAYPWMDMSHCAPASYGTT